MNLFGRKKTKFLGINGIRYRDGKRSLYIFSEIAGDPAYDSIIYLTQSKHWDPPFDEEMLTEDDYQRIRKHIGEDYPKLKFDWA